MYFVIVFETVLSSINREIRLVAWALILWPQETVAGLGGLESNQMIYHPQRRAETFALAIRAPSAR
jgi:hypothetical protein